MKKKLEEATAYIIISRLFSIRTSGLLLLLLVRESVLFIMNPQNYYYTMVLLFSLSLFSHAKSGQL
jgi:hypothetical protein